MGMPINGVDSLCMWHDLNFKKSGADWTNMRSEANWNKLRPDQQIRPEGGTMSLNKNTFVLTAKLAIVAWGIASLLQGAALSFFVNGANQYRQTAFIELVYDSVFIGGLVSLFWSLIASGALFVATLAALAILLWTRSFGHGASFAPPLLWAIAIRPALGALVLFLLSFYEGRPGKRVSLAS